MKYKSVIATKLGGPDVLQVIEHDLRLPSAGEVCIKILAAGVCRPDISARRVKRSTAARHWARRPRSCRVTPSSVTWQQWAPE